MPKHLFEGEETTCPTPSEAIKDAQKGKIEIANDEGGLIKHSSFMIFLDL